MQLEQTIRTQILEAKGMRLGDFKKVEDAVNLVDIMVKDNCAEFGHALQMVKHDETPILDKFFYCLLYTSPSPRDGLLSRMPSSA